MLTLGYLSAQFGLSYVLSSPDRALLEHAHFHAQLIYPTLLMLLLQFLDLRSAYVMAFITAVQFVGALGHRISGPNTTRLARRLQSRGVSILWGYALPMTAMIALGIEAITSVSYPSGHTLDAVADLCA